MSIPYFYIKQDCQVGQVILEETGETYDPGAAEDGSG